MSVKSSNATRFDLGRSRGLVAWLAVVHGGAIVAAWSSALPAVVAAAASIVVVASCIRGMRLHALRLARDAVVRLELSEGLRIELASGAIHSARLRARPLVHPWLVTLAVDFDTGSAMVLVPSDSMASPAAHRAVRRCLRDGGPS